MIEAKMFEDFFLKSVAIATDFLFGYFYNDSCKQNKSDYKKGVVYEYRWIAKAYYKRFSTVF